MTNINYVFSDDSRENLDSILKDIESIIGPAVTAFYEKRGFSDSVKAKKANDGDTVLLPSITVCVSMLHFVLCRITVAPKDQIFMAQELLDAVRELFPVEAIELYMERLGDMSKDFDDDPVGEPEGNA